MECYSAIKRNGVLTHATIQMILSSWVAGAHANNPSYLEVEIRFETKSSRDPHLNQLNLGVVVLTGGLESWVSWA
jgi:hypothetical protein